MSQRGSREDTGGEKQQLRGNLAPAGRHSDLGCSREVPPPLPGTAHVLPAAASSRAPPPASPAPFSPASRRRGPCCDCRPLQDGRRRQGGSTVVSEPPATTGSPAELSSKGVSLVQSSPRLLLQG